MATKERIDQKVVDSEPGTDRTENTTTKTGKGSLRITFTRLSE